MKVYAVARDTDTGRQFWTGEQSPVWTDDLARAAWTGDHDLAQADADKWSDYWAVKGHGNRAFVASFTAAELEALGLEI